MVNKGAMFGLDARIALAIFGALSVISGAALYSAIENSKATALLTDMQEVGKAWEAYLLDTGSDLPAYSATSNGPNYRDLTGLTEDTGVAGWQGPYTSLPQTVADTKLLDHLPSKGRVYLISAQDTTWGGSNDWSSAFCTDDKDCFIWVYMNRVDVAYYKKIDELVDGGDGNNKGNFRYATVSDGYDDRVALKIAPYSRP